MIEKTVLDYLKSALDVPVHMEKPKVEEMKYIFIEKTGSSSENHINSATIAVQSYANSLYEAAQLNEQVKNAMSDIIYHEDISKSALNSDYNFTDTTKKKYRYQAVFDLFY